MRPIRIIFFLIVFSHSPVYTFDCSRAKTETEKGICSDSNEIPFVFRKGVTLKDCDDSKVIKIIYSPIESGKITGSGKVYFYKSPDERCKSTNLFLIPNDSVVIYESTGDSKFEFVMFITKGGNYVYGWVESKNIRHTGSAEQ